MDPVDLLFKRLPGPEALEIFYQYNTEEAWRYIHNCFADFKSTSITTRSRDPDQAILVEVAHKCYSAATSFRFHYALGKLAIERGYESTLRDTSLKGVHMRYGKWVIRGRRQNEWPNVLDPSLSVIPVSYAKLPGKSDSRTTCSACGHMQMLNCTSCTKVPKWGNACRLDYDGLYLFAWNCPDPACKDLERLRRAASVFQPIFVALHAYDYSCHAKQIWLASQSITLVYDFKNRYHNALMAGHPLMKAVKHPICLSGWCWEVLTTVKPIFDLLLSPLCSRVEEVDFVIKNVHRMVTTRGPRKTQYNSDSRHIVVKLTTQSGLELAFDPTGIQFGWEEVISPWSVYAQNRIHFIYRQTVVHKGSRRSKAHDSMHRGLEYWAIQVLKTEATLWAADKIQEVVQSFGYEGLSPLFDAKWEQWKRWRVTLEAQCGTRIEWMINEGWIEVTKAHWQLKAREKDLVLLEYLCWADINNLFDDEFTDDESCSEQSAF